MPNRSVKKAQGSIKPNQNKAGRRKNPIESSMGVRYRALVEQVPAIIYTDSAEKIYHTIYISPQLKTITGYEPDEWLADDGLWSRIMVEEDRQRVLEEYEETYTAKEPSISEYRLKRRDGRIIWVSDETRLIRDRKGKPLFWQGVMVDITERKRAEQVQQAIYRISHAVVTTSSLDELFSSIHQILAELMPVHNLYIALYDPDDDLLSFPYYVDQYDEPPAPAKPEHGLTEYVLRTREPLWATAQVFDRLVQQGEVETVGTDSADWIGVPLPVGEHITGVMVTRHMPTTST